MQHHFCERGRGGCQGALGSPWGARMPGGARVNRDHSGHQEELRSPWGAWDARGRSGHQGALGMPGCAKGRSGPQNTGTSSGGAAWGPYLLIAWSVALFPMSKRPPKGLTVLPPFCPTFPFTLPLRGSHFCLCPISQNSSSTFPLVSTPGMSQF